MAKLYKIEMEEEDWKGAMNFLDIALGNVDSTIRILLRDKKEGKLSKQLIESRLHDAFSSRKLLVDYIVMIEDQLEKQGLTPRERLYTIEHVS